MVITNGYLVLGVSRKEDHSKFGFPGGKQEYWETEKDCAIREAYEETGLLVSSCFFLLSRTEPPVNNISYHTTCFVADKFSGLIKSNEDLIIRWMTPKDLCSLEFSAFPDYNREVFLKLGII
jgi:8-oxo-dGTP pyrophosphatase MutT (NUDIX family)